MHLETLKGSSRRDWALPRIAHRDVLGLNKGMPYVLIVDDEEPIRNLLRRQVAGLGYRVRTASTAMGALELMGAEPADMALIDLRMPGRDGLWLTERIHEKWRKTAVVIITAVDDITLIENNKEIGVVDYLRKPFDRESLRQALERAAKAVEGPRAEPD
jgi:CheY-like chemotaxis protein